MSRDMLIGIDAGTSVIKSVAFTLDGRQVGMAGRPNSYRSLPGGGVEQDMARTWADTVATLRDLLAAHPGLADRVAAVAVTGQGDGTWLIDAAGAPVGDAFLWLDARAADLVREVIGRGDHLGVYAETGTGINACQQSAHLAWLARHEPGRLDAAVTACHAKDWLYFSLTGIRATDPSEAVFTFGRWAERAYGTAALDAYGLGPHRRLLPAIVDGVGEAHPLSADAAAATGLPAGLPVILGYVDVVCTALGGGLYDPGSAPGLSILGSTGMHMRLAEGREAVRLNDRASGYVMCFPVPDAWAQMQSNMAATLNIDWIVDLALGVLAGAGVAETRGGFLSRADALVLAAPPGGAMFHPYISTAGERGPFMDPDARASLTGLDLSMGYPALMRAVYEGLAHAARDCYAAMGAELTEVRLTGGAARSTALRRILAATLGVPLRRQEREEAGAAGAAMMAAVQTGVYPDMAACVADWVRPGLGAAEEPDPALKALADRLHPVYVQTREALAPVWAARAAAARGTT